jgi:hypothetical protein
MEFKRKWFQLLSLIFIIWLTPACDLLDSLKDTDEVSYFISSFESLSNPEVVGSLTDNGAPASNLSVANITASESQITFTLASPNLVRLTFSIPAKNGTFTLMEDVPSNEDGIEAYADGYSFFGKSGSATVSSYSTDILDGTRGKISFKLKGEGVFGGTDPRSINRTIGFDLTVNFDNRNDPVFSPPSNPGGGTGGTGGGSGSSGGSNACVNSIDANIQASYWPQLVSGSATGTGRKVAANAIFSNYKSTDVALVIEGNTGGTRYMVQIMLTGSNLVANKSLDFINGGTGAGLTSAGAVGRLIASKGTVNDDWRTNRDWGKNQDRGNLTILTVSPQITGTYDFEASGDGYPSLNKQYARVVGKFCIDP